MLLMRLAVTNSSTFPVLTAALGRYGNVPTHIEWMQRLLQQLFATEHLVFDDSILGPSGTFLHRSTWDTDLPLPTATPQLRRDKEPSCFSVDEEAEIQIRGHHAKNRGARTRYDDGHDAHNSTIGFVHFLAAAYWRSSYLHRGNIMAPIKE